ncbi:hypothetical protein [Bradyrhizobium sp. STM 3566]|uniref:hypothetical protein n=1 Tax=Bradyrhizobium sp. STM 3566 TaxID=578928 RepID=UPI00388D1379
MTRPAPHIVKAKKREIQVRYRRKFNYAPVRVAEIDRLLVSRYGQHLPNDDAGRDDALVMVHHLAQISGDAPARISRWLAKRAPWMPPDEIEALMTRVFGKPIRWRAPTLGKRMQLTYAERCRLRITTIAAIDISQAEVEARRAESKRLAKEAKRRKAGVKPRATYEAASIGRGEPWIAEGMSRATWYRRQKQAAPQLQ